jgi:phage tail sheath gpL-like
MGAQLVPVIVPNVPCVGATPTANVNEALSISVPDRVITAAVSSAVVTLCALETGTSLTAVIVRLTVAAGEVRLPSLTVNVKLSAPL